MDVTSSVLKFSDDTKVARVAESEEQREVLQSTINRLLESSVEAVEYETDVGLIVHQSLKPSMKCVREAARANGILGQRNPGKALQRRLIQGQVHLLQIVQGVRSGAGPCGWGWIGRSWREIR